MPQYVELMRKIAIEDGKQLQRPCRPDQIARLQEQAQAELRVKLPQEYIDFLRFTNGYIWNGLEIYASETAPLVGEPDANVMGLVEVNLILRDAPGADEHVYLAECNDEFYGVRLENGSYCGFDMASGDVFEEYESFDHMISSVLHQLLEPLESLEGSQ